MIRNRNNKFQYIKYKRKKTIRIRILNKKPIECFYNQKKILVRIYKRKINFKKRYKLIFKKIKKMKILINIFQFNRIYYQMWNKNHNPKKTNKIK